MRILIASRIDGDAVSRLRRDHDVVCGFERSEPLANLIADRHALVFRSGVEITAELMDRAPDLKLIVRAGSGLDNVDATAAEQRGIRLVRIPEPGSVAVAELTLGLMIALARKILPADAAWRRGEWVKHDLHGRTLAGKTLGIVGAGNIGARVGELGTAFGMNVLGCVERASPSHAASLARRGIRQTAFDEVLEASDFVSVHVPLTLATRGMIGEQALALMKPGVFLLSLARGGVVVEDALRNALLEGRVAGAALDVHQAEGPGCVSGLADLTNVILTPHIGATTVDTQREIGRRVLEIVESLERTGSRTEMRRAAS